MQVITYQSSSKYLKIVNDSYDDPYFSSNFTTKSKILPIPIMRKNIDRTSKTMQKLALHNYKYLRKLTACGQETPVILKNIRKSKSLKYIYDFEFDPYLYDYSGLQELAYASKKLRMSKHFTLKIRRVNMKNETDIFAPHISRIRRMTTFKLLFPSTGNIDGKALKKLAKNYVKCQQIRSIQFQFCLMPLIGQIDYIKPILSLGKLPKLERFYWHAYVLFSPNIRFISPIKVRFPRLPKLQVFDYKIAAKNSWTSLAENHAEFLPWYFEIIGPAVNPEIFDFKFHKYVVSSDALMVLSNILPHFTKMRHLSLEFTGCRLQELEISILCHGFKQCTQIEKLTFKLIQYLLFPSNNLDFKKDTQHST